MAKRKDIPLLEGEPMPEYLNSWWSDTDWWDGGKYAEPSVHRSELMGDSDYRMEQIHKAYLRIGEARNAYLRGLTVKPPGVSELEWRTAHHGKYTSLDS